MVDRGPPIRRRNDGVGALQHHDGFDPSRRGTGRGQLVVADRAKQLGEFAAMGGDDRDAAQPVGLARAGAERIGIGQDLPLRRDQRRQRFPRAVKPEPGAAEPRAPALVLKQRLQAARRSR